MTTHLHSTSLIVLLAALGASCNSADLTSGAGGATASTSSDASASASSGAGGSSTSTGAATSTGATSVTSSAAASTSSGGPAGEPSCATTGKNLLICDDFEAEALGSAPDPTIWTVDKGAGATVAVDDSQFRHGKHALHLHTLPDSNKALMHETKTFPLPGGTNSLYGRANVMIAAGLKVPTDHTNFFEASGKVNGQDGNYRYGAAGAKYFANYNPGDPGESSKTAVPVGVWSCVEWAFLGDTNEMRFWIDDKEITDLAVPPAGINGKVWAAPDFDSFYFGWITYATDTASDHYDIWYDDVAIDTARIGCAI
jgi:hypothetical protein